MITNGSERIQGVPALDQEGFSLPEMFIMLGLIIVLSGVLLSFRSASYQHEQQKACQDNLSKIYVALEIYAGDCAGKFPETNGVQTSEEALNMLVPRYTADTSIFICPGSKDSSLPAGEPFRKRKISYAYYMGWHLAAASGVLMSDRQINTLPKKAGDLAFSTTGKPPGNNHYKYGGNFLFCDGHMELTKPRPPFSLVVTQGVVLLNPKP